MQANALGPLTPYNPPPVGALKGYSVNREGQFEVIWQPQYDHLAYPNAGATQLTFFQRTVGGAGNLGLTSMRAQGQFPSPQEFLVTGIQLWFRPANAIPIMAAATATATARTWSNDVSNVMFRSGAWLELFVGSKPYLDDAPLGKFTQQFKQQVSAAIATGDPATTYNSWDYSVHCGKYYAITPIKIPKNQNFQVTVNFAAAVALTSAGDGTIGCILDGFLYRLSQ